MKSLLDAILTTPMPAWFWWWMLVLFALNAYDGVHYLARDVRWIVRRLRKR